MWIRRLIHVDGNGKYVLTYVVAYDILKVECVPNILKERSQEDEMKDVNKKQPKHEGEKKELKKESPVEEILSKESEIIQKSVKKPAVKDFDEMPIYLL